jgi:hypothetical protein
VAFEPFPLPGSAARAVVRIAGHGLSPDDAFHFVLAPGGDVPVLILEPAGAPARKSLYLRRALEIGQRPRFRVTVKPATQVAAEDLAAARVIVLNGAAPGAATARRLRELAERGGGLVVALGDQSGTGGWQGEAARLLPGAFVGATDRSSDWGGTLAYLNYPHPVFELFRGPRTGDFSSARFFRYHPLEAPDGVLARFDDGAVALAEKKVGRGRVLIWTSTLDTLWNDLPLQPVFLPFVHQLVKHASGHVDSRPWYTVGEALDLSTFEELSGREAAVVTPSGEKLRLDASRRGLELSEPGFYEVRRLEAGGGSRLVAVNFDASESDLSAVDPEELAAAVTQPGGLRDGRRAAPALTTEEREGRQALWRYLLMAALALLVAETVLSNRAAARPRTMGATP